MSPTLVVGIVVAAVGLAISIWMLVARFGRVPFLFGVYCMLSGAWAAATSLVPDSARLGTTIFFSACIAWVLLMIHRARNSPEPDESTMKRRGRRREGPTA